MGVELRILRSVPEGIGNDVGAASAGDLEAEQHQELSGETTVGVSSFRVWQLLFWGILLEEEEQESTAAAAVMVVSRQRRRLGLTG